MLLLICTTYICLYHTPSIFGPHYINETIIDISYLEKQNNVRIAEDFFSSLFCFDKHNNSHPREFYIELKFFIAAENCLFSSVLSPFLAGYAHCCTDSTILNFMLYIMSWHFLNTNSI